MGKLQRAGLLLHAELCWRSAACQCVDILPVFSVLCSKLKAFANMQRALC